ncbi:MAG: glycosyltransferase 61 family protein [Prevotella sp.]|nr:glycosyltransferase 61 family protein [Prevotellaceae bacterium]MDY3935561.1 glycosyltransferase 61 family protein [Prevotella sp.]
MIEAFVKHKNIFLSKVKPTRKFTGALKCHIHNNATVLPFIQKDGGIWGGIIDENGNFIEKSRFNDKIGNTYKYTITNEGEDCAIYIGGVVFPAWGHCITDDLKFIWWLLSDECHEIIAANPNIRLVCTPSPFWNGVDGLMLFLGYLGIDKEKIDIIDKPKKYAQLYLPDPCFITDKEGRKLWTNEYNDLIERLIQKISFPKGLEPKEKIYFSRTKIANKRDFGEKYVEEAFRKAGYYIVYPEQLSFPEQLFYIRQAKIMAVTEGSVSHNAIFLSKETKLIIIRKAVYVNEYQIAVNEARGLNAVYIDAFLSFLNNKKIPIIGPFFIYVNNRLANYLGITPHFPLWEFIRYIRYSLFHRDILERLRW